MARRPSEQLHFATRHPDDGRALRYHFDEFVLDWLPRVADELTRRACVQAVREHVRPELVELYVEQALYVDLLDAARQIFRSQYAVSQGGRPFDVPVPPDLADLLRLSLPDGGVRIAASSAIGLLSRMARLRRRVRDSWHARAALGTPALRAGSVAVELVEGADPSRKCDAFWLAGGEIDPAAVLFVLEPLNLTLVDVAQNLAAIRKMGSRVVALDPRMTSGGAIPYWRPRAVADWVTELIQRLPRPADRADRWLRRALSDLVARVGYWQAFYEDHGVLAVQQFTELSTETAAKRIAIDLVGGIEMGKMRSQFFEQASAAFHFQHEVAFVWHRNVAPYLRSGRTRTEVLVETGYVYDYLLRGLVDDAQSLRQRLVAQPAVVASVFDNDPHLNGHFSPADLESFYRVILGLAARHPQLGLIVKSKKPRVLANLPTIAAELARLAVGRSVVLDEPLSSVVPAALASDLAFGFPTSTAGCEAALAGCKVLMYDPACAGDHPWISPQHSIVFRDADAFERAASSAVSAVGRGSGMSRDQLLELDPHLDQQSARRAAAFVRAFLDARLGGSAKGESLAAALRHCSGYAFRMDAPTL